MNLNATLFVQMLCFIAFVAVTLKYIWPPVEIALETRRKEIADGLAAAEQGKKELELADHKAGQQLTDAKLKAAHIIELANQREDSIVDAAKQKAFQEGQRIIEQAQVQIDQSYQQIKLQLMQEVSQVAIKGAEKILRKELDQASNDELVQRWVSEES